jgi:hypothetical protein
MAKKSTFPNRPCPKCGKPIHIKSKKHEECGWVMEGSATRKPTATPPTREANKSAAVRAILKTNPKAPVKEIVSTLAAQGVKISENYIYTLKSGMKAKKRVEKPQRMVAVNRNGTSSANPVDLIRDVKHLAARAGGLRTLKELVDVLAE